MQIRVNILFDWMVKLLMRPSSQYSKAFNIFAFALIIIGLISIIVIAIDANLSTSDTIERNKFIIYHLKNLTPVFLSALIIIFRNKLKKTILVPLEEGSLKSKEITFFGEVINASQIQLFMIIMTWVFNSYEYYGFAYMFALLAIVLGYFLTRIRRVLIGTIGIINSLIYIYLYHTWFTDFEYRSNKILESFKHPLNEVVEIYFLVLIVSFAAPYIRRCQLGSFHFGRLRGDLYFKVLGHVMFIPLMSTLLFVTLINGLPKAFFYGYSLINSFISK